MAKLQRFIKLNDRFDSQVFTFMLPPKLVTENNPDTYTKDVIYGYHKWTAIFTRSDVHLGCFLKLISGCEGMKLQIDFSFTLLNREHFTRNETFIEKSCIFTQESTQHGRKNFVALGEIVERDFAHGSGEYLIELEMRKINCSFECYIRLPRETPNTRYSNETRLESSYFSYGLCDWSISLNANEGSVQQDEHVTVQLHRHTSFDHICNVRYYITLGDNGAFQSEELDQLVDTTGNGETYEINGSVHHLARGRSSLRMKINMVSVVTVSEVTLNVASRSNSRAHLYDRDKQAWLMEADTTGKYLSLCLYYTDVTHVPRKYSRYVCWNVLVLTRYIPDHKVKTNYGPFSRYYVQQDLDEGFHILTSIPVDELHDERCLYTEPDDLRITVHIEWIDSHLLAQPMYHAQDDIDKLQKHQMKREIIALQSENLALEKQLLVYQQSLSKTTERDKDKEKKKDKTPPTSVVEKTQSRDQRMTEKATPITTPSHTPTERKGSRDESGYYSDKTSGLYNEKNVTTYSEKSSGYHGDKTGTSSAYIGDKVSSGSSYIDKTTGVGYYSDKGSVSSSYVDKPSAYYGDKTSSNVGYVTKASSSSYYSDKTNGNGRHVDKTSGSTSYVEKTNGTGTYFEKSGGSGYYSDRSERSYYKEKVPTEYYDRPRSERHRNERRRSSNREGREKSHDRSSTSSNDRLSYRYR